MKLYRIRPKIESAVDRKRQLASVAVFAIGFIVVVFAGRELWLGLRDDAVAQTEYTYLRELSVSREDAPAPNVFAEINPDFVGWIVVPGTTIDYPVVRGSDNSRYLNTMFSGAPNPAGAIFMDYRCTKGFNAPVCMIYGHNMRDGSMFSPLTRYPKQAFIDDHPEIIILTADGKKLVYRIFEAQRTDAWDSVYTLDFNDAKAAAKLHTAANAERFLILSTCLSGADRNVRFLVFAALTGN